MYLDEVVEDVVKAARVLASTKEVSIELETATSAAFTGDEDLIRRLMVNLLDNAVRHAPAGSAVRVDLRRGAGRICALGQRSWSRHSSQIQPHIFERFYRADAARARSDGGAGLGLALARWIARCTAGTSRWCGRPSTAPPSRRFFQIAPLLDLSSVYPPFMLASVPWSLVNEQRRCHEG